MVRLAIHKLRAEVQPPHSSAACTNELRLSSQHLHFGPSDAVTTIQWLLPHLPSLRSLSLNLPRFSQARTAHILHSASCLTSLTSLSISDCCMLTAAAHALAGFLPYVPRLQSLSLLRPQLADYALSVITPAILAARALTSLCLNGLHLTPRGLVAMLDAFVRCTRLRVLNLAHNFYFMPQCSRFATFGLVSDGTARLAGCGLERVWTGATHLRELTVNNCCLGTPPVLPPQCTALRAMHLLPGDAGEDGCQWARALVPRLTGLTQLTALALEPGVFDSRVTRGVAAVLAALPALRHLDLAGFAWEQRQGRGAEAPGLGPGEHAGEAGAPDAAELGFLAAALQGLTALTFLRAGDWFARVVGRRQSAVLAALPQLASLEVPVLLDVQVVLPGALPALTRWVGSMYGEEPRVEHLEAALGQLNALQDLALVWPVGCGAQLPRTAAVWSHLSGCITSFRKVGFPIAPSDAPTGPAKECVRVAAAAAVDCFPALLRLDLWVHADEELRGLPTMLQPLSGLTSLRLHIRIQDCDERSFQALSGAFRTLRKLREFTVAEAALGNMTTRSLAALAQGVCHLTRLTVLHVPAGARAGSIFPIVDASTRDLWRAALVRLQLLQRVSGSSHLLPLDALAQLPLLTSLNLVVPPLGLTSEALSVLGTLTGLEALELDHWRCFERGYGAGLTVLSQLTQLTKLSLMSDSLLVVDVRSLATVLPKLLHLQILLLVLVGSLGAAVDTTFCEAVKLMPSLAFLSVFSGELPVGMAEMLREALPGCAVCLG